MSYSLNRSQLNAAIDDLFDMSKRIDRAVAEIRAITVASNALPTTYSGLATAINTDATNNPSDQVYTDLKDEKDQVVSDFQSTITRIEAIDAELVTLGELASQS